MKSLFKSLCITFFALILTSCAEKSPDTIAKEFAKAFYKGNINKAKSFCSGDASDQVKDFAESTLEIRDNMSKEKPVVEILNSEVSDDNKATVIIRVTDYFDPESGEVTKEGVEDTLKLEKTDDKWIIVSTPYGAIENGNDDARKKQINTVAKNFMYAFYVGDFDAAVTYCSDNTADVLHRLHENIMPLIPQMQECKPEIEIFNTEVSNDGMAAKVKFNSRGYFAPNRQRVMRDWDPDEVDLVLVDGRWIVIKQ